MSDRRYKVALIGYYGFGNLGDELLAEAAVAALVRCGVERKRIVVLSNDPLDSERRLGVDCVDRWKPKHIWRVLSQSDTLLLGGGGLFQDTTSLRSCFYYWGLVRAACFRSVIPWALGQSVGPLLTRPGRWMTEDALERCRVLQVRDAVSSDLCESLGIPCETGHDLVLTLGDAFDTKEDDAGGSGTVSLVNLRPCPGGLPERFAAAVANHVRATGDKLVGVAFSEEDARLMETFASEGRLPLLCLERAATLKDVVRVWSGAKFAAGMRLHFSVLSTLARVPAIAVPYDPKVEAFAKAQDIPLWYEGPLPEPRLPRGSPDLLPEALRADLDALCRRGLGVFNDGIPNY